MGRTGRKRDGKIIILVSEGREESLYNKTLSQHQHVQRVLQKPSSFKLHARVSFLPNVPCIKQFFEIDHASVAASIAVDIKASRKRSELGPLKASNCRTEESGLLDDAQVRQ